MAYVQTEEGRVYQTDSPEHWIKGGAIELTRKDGERLATIQARADLRKVLKPGDTVYCVLRGVSSSGMSRRIDLYVYRPREKGGRPEPVYLSGLAATATGRKLHKDGGIVVHGCGMDMGFELVYTLSSAVFPSYRCTGQGKDGRRRCPSNYHSNHRDMIRCEGPEGRRCYHPSVGRDDPAWPTIPTAVGDGSDPYDAPAYAVNLEDDDEKPERWAVCPRCDGTGYYRNPDGPERWDLVHRDGYALRSSWQ